MKVLNRGAKITLWAAVATGLMAAVTYVLAHVGELELDPMLTLALTALLTGVLAAIENAIKHRGEMTRLR